MSNEFGNTPADKNYKPSGVSRAEEMANKRWPIHPWTILPKEGEHGEIINFDEWLDDFRLGVQSFSLNAGYKEGYEQAEKDLALTIQDLELLHTFLYAVKNNKHGCFTFTRLSDEQYKGILARFKQLKEAKK